MLATKKSTLGFAGVGLIPEHKYKPHLFFANVAFVGYILSANFFLIPLLFSSSLTLLSSFQKILLFCCYAGFEISFITMISAFFINGGDKLHFNQYKWKGFPIWEWIYFWNIVGWTVVIAVVVRSL
ncbi:hypothetical protein [Candidatus Lokiarchaeum ossiferum]|uniref:hypothetical protein n=1 Tax=Candidatus Lokiarchaeum ossiferum TaxID=2951803 RepID=UPI00352D68A1